MAAHRRLTLETTPETRSEGVGEEDKEAQREAEEKWLNCWYKLAGSKV
jgi:hypothetical protein